MPTQLKQRLSGIMFCLVFTVAASACAGGSAPQSPSSLIDPSRVELRIYDSAKGFVRSVYRQADVVQALTVTVGELNAGTVDSLRLAVRQAHLGDQLGGLLAFSSSGLVTVLVTPGTQYDVFLMSSLSGVSYDCLDYDGERGAGGIEVRYATLRRASARDNGLPALFALYPAVDGPDDHFQWAAGLVSRALNPFGLRFGSVTFTTAGTADIVASWASIPTMGLSAPGQMVVWDGYRTYPMIPTTVHELTHAWLGASDYYRQTGCWEGHGLDGLLFPAGGAQQGLSPRGEDALRYWALKRDSWR